MKPIQEVMDDTLNAFNTLMPPTLEQKQLYHTITQAEYEQFQYYWIIDALKGWRYGQAFCERFGISNASPLYHFRGQEISERWIRDNYLMNNETEIR
jgi:hypothetical protein